MIFAGEQFKKELRSLIERWKLESDLSDQHLVFSAVEALNEFNDEEIIEFEADDKLNDDVRNQETRDDI